MTNHQLTHTQDEDLTGNVSAGPKSELGFLDAPDLAALAPDCLSNLTVKYCYDLKFVIHHNVKLELVNASLKGAQSDLHPVIK